MGKQYAVEFKESILKRILPPNNGYIPEISRETGIPVDTLYLIFLKSKFASGIFEGRIFRFVSEDTPLTCVPFSRL